MCIRDRRNTKGSGGGVWKPDKEKYAKNAVAESFHWLAGEGKSVNKTFCVRKKGNQNEGEMGQQIQFVERKEAENLLSQHLEHINEQ